MIHIQHLIFSGRTKIHLAAIIIAYALLSGKKLLENENVGEMTSYCSPLINEDLKNTSPW